MIKQCFNTQIVRNKAHKSLHKSFHVWFLFQSKEKGELVSIEPLGMDKLK